MEEKSIGICIGENSDGTITCRLHPDFLQRSRGKDTPLQVAVEDDQLIIRIGIDVLAFAFENSNQNMPFNEEVKDYIKVDTVCDPLEFAKDVRGMLTAEREDGSHILSDLLDEACVAAVIDGSLGVTDKDYPWGKG